MDPLPEMTLAVLQDPVGLHPVPVISLSWGEARAAYPADQAPLLLIGQTVSLGFRGEALEGVAHARGVVVRRADDGGVRTYDFQLDHLGGTALDAAVNRRASLRVPPEPGSPVRVNLRQDPADPGVHALMRDLSTGGMSVLVGREQEWLLARVDRVWLELRLPGATRELQLVGRVVHRRLERTAIHYGIAFEEPEEGREAPLEAVRRYVEDRSRAMRVRGADSDAA
jgi:hypothetical protein